METQLLLMAKARNILLKRRAAHQQKNGHSNLTVETCGLFISRLNNWLAATQQDIVNDPSCTSDTTGLVEIKCPFSLRDMFLSEACKKPSFCLSQTEENELRLKKRHDYWFQIQCQLYCVDKQRCDFVVRTNKQLHVEHIYRDTKWWGLHLYKLRKFYFCSVLPELACPRFRCGEIREPIKNLESTDL